MGRKSSAPYILPGRKQTESREAGRCGGYMGQRGETAYKLNLKLRMKMVFHKMIYIAKGRANFAKKTLLEKLVSVNMRCKKLPI